MAVKNGKLTVSVSKDLLALADKMAAEMKVSRSRVISLCLQQMAEKRKENAMKEGYLAMAEQHDKFFGMASATLQKTSHERKQHDGK